MFDQKSLKALFFDLDGTLANSLGVMFLAYEKFLAAYCIQSSKEEFEKLNGPTLPYIVAYLKKKYSLKPGVDSLLIQYNQIIDELYLEVGLNDGAGLLIEAALKNHFKLAIVTSNSKTRTNQWLVKLGLAQKFSFIVTGDDVSLGKPSPEPYLLALETSQVKAHQALAIEDSVQGADSAIKAGMTTFLLSKKHSKQQPYRNNSFYLSSLLDLHEILFLN